jgi:hypothetical protein
MKLMQFFQDDTGANSATRLAFLVWSVGVFVIWAAVCFSAKTLIDIPNGVIYVTIVFMGGKTAHAFIENTPPTSPKLP